MVSSFWFRGLTMTYERLLTERAYVAEMEAKVRQDYPGHVDEARAVMNQVLRRTDRQKWLVFNGQSCDRGMELGELCTTLRYVSSLLECRDRGQPVTDLYLESAVRACLGLGFAVVHGGQAE